MNAREWLAAGASHRADITVVGAPISKASISPSEAWATPAAIRVALARFPTWDAAHGVDLEQLRVRDAGDIQGDREDADAAAAHARIERALRDAAASSACVCVLGGDNSLTRPAMDAMMSARPGTWGLITLDAHHDCRPLDAGPRNGTPVRELIEAGLPGARVVQVGIHPWGNQREHAAWARAQGAHVFTIDHVRRAGIAAAVDEALLALTREGCDRVYADIDVDVVDRAFAPACPASMPGGLLPAELLEAAHHIGGDARLGAFDIVEVDTNADVNGITTRLAAAVLLEVCSGIAGRTSP